MIYIIVALKIEASPLIEAFKLKKRDFLYLNSNIILIVSGVGKKNSAQALKKLNIQKDDIVINFGICGAKDKNIKIGDIFLTQGSNFFPNKTISSFDRAVDESFDIKTDLVDMEAEGFYEEAKKFTNNIYILKIVSDHLDTKFLKKEFVYSLINKKIKKIKEFIWQIE